MDINGVKQRTGGFREDVEAQAYHLTGNTYMKFVPSIPSVLQPINGYAEAKLPLPGCCLSHT
jgi:hypothetical protein